MATSTERAASDALLSPCPELEIVAFSGQTTAKLFARHVGERARAARPGFRYATLPSTSPAHASPSFAEKYAR